MNYVLKLFFISGWIVFSLSGQAQPVISMYVSNHAMYLTYGDGEQRAVALRSSTLNPMLATDIASWTGNNSPSRALYVMLQTLTETDQFKEIKTQLEQNKQLPQPEPVKVVIFAAGVGFGGKFDANNCFVTTSFCEEFKSNLFAETDVAKDELIHKLCKRVSSGMNVTKSEAHKTAFKVILNHAFDYPIEMLEVYADADLMMNIAEKNNALASLWSTTYAIIHLLDDANGGHKAKYSEPHQMLPQGFQEKGYGGIYALGKKSIANESPIMLADAGNASNIGKPLIAFFLESYVNAYQNRQKLWRADKYPLTSEDMVARVTRPQNPLGFVNVGELAVELLDEKALYGDGGAGVDPHHHPALSTAYQAVFDQLGDDDYTRKEQEIEQQKVAVAQEAMTRYLLALFLKYPEGRNDAGILVGEYAQALFGNGSNINMNDYLENRYFMGNLVRLVKQHEDYGQLDNLEAKIKARFVNHQITVISQKALLDSLHQLGFEKAKKASTPASEDRSEASMVL